MDILQLKDNISKKIKSFSNSKYFSMKAEDMLKQFLLFHLREFPGKSDVAENLMIVCENQEEGVLLARELSDIIKDNKEGIIYSEYSVDDMLDRIAEDTLPNSDIIIMKDVNDLQNPNWIGAEKYLSESTSIIKIMVVCNDIAKSIYKESQHVFYRVFSDHLFLDKFTVEEITDTVVYRLTRLGYKCGDDFIAALREYNATIVPKADLEDGIYIKDLFDRIIRNIAHNAFDTIELGEEVIPYYVKETSEEIIPVEITEESETTSEEKTENVLEATLEEETERNALIESKTGEKEFQYKSNILIAQIGRGNYKITPYVDGELIEKDDIDEFKTGYTFDASFSQMGKKYPAKNNYLVLVGTESSLWGNLCYYYSKNNISQTNDIDTIISELKTNKYLKDVDITGTNKGNNIEISINDIYENKEIIENYLSEVISVNNNKVIVKIVIIKYGVNTLELNENFDLLYQATEQVLNEEQSNDVAENISDQIINIGFDISNGFRSIPVYIYNFMNYLLRVRQEKFELKMYYGMFEAQANYRGKTPLIDLESVNELMRWINAANEFLNYGAVREVVKIFGDIEDKVEDKNAKEKILQIKNAFRKFDYASNANNLSMLKDSIAFISELDSFVDDISDFELQIYEKKLLKKIASEFKEEFNQQFKNTNIKANYSYSYLTLHLAEWFYKQGRFGNAAIALQEGVTTFIMERWPELSNEYITNAINIKNNNSECSNSYNYIDEVYNSEADFRNWISEYKNREFISYYFKNNNHGLDSNTFLYNFIDKMKMIRENIRNTGAHILLKDFSIEDIDNFNQTLKELIDIMLILTSDENRNNDQSIFIFNEILLDSFKAFINVTDSIEENDNYSCYEWYSGWKQLVGEFNEYSNLYNDSMNINDKVTRIKQLSYILEIKCNQTNGFDKSNDIELQKMFGKNAKGIAMIDSIKNYILDETKSKSIFNIIYS